MIPLNGAYIRLKNKLITIIIECQNDLLDPEHYAITVLFMIDDSVTSFGFQ